MIRSKIFLSFGLVILLAFSSCSDTSNQTNGKLKIVVTTNIIADCVKEIVGSSAEVYSIMGAGVDPHSYKASQGDVELLLKADLIVYNGLHLEGKMSDVLKNISTRRKTICLSDGLKADAIRSINLQADVHDPHFWFDIMKWKAGLQYFVHESSRYFPAIKDSLIARSIVYYEKMDDLHREVIEKIKTIPSDQRFLITSHDAFEYYGEAYNISVRGLQGISTLSEAGLKDVTELVNFITDNEIKAVFIESSVSKKALLSVIEGCHKKGHDVKIGGELFSDALDSSGEPGGSYLGMLRYNTQLIVNALK